MSELEGNQVRALSGSGGAYEGGAVDAFDARLRISDVFARHGLDVGSLAVAELSELEEIMSSRLAPVVGAVVEQWQEEHRALSEQEMIDRELRRRITGDRRDISDDYFVCEGCGYRNREHLYFTDFHDLYLCDGCLYLAREELRDIQRPLIESLEAEPTLEHARALGFELVRRNGRLAWDSDDGYFDGDSRSYADEQEALDDLIGELG